jgi:hypothetical protein
VLTLSLSSGGEACPALDSEQRSLKSEEDDDALAPVEFVETGPGAEVLTQKHQVKNERKVSLKNIIIEKC